MCQQKGKEGSHCRLRALTATDSRLKTTSRGSLQGTERSEFRSYKTARTSEKQECFEHARRKTESQGLCENLINALKLLANQQKDSPVNMVLQCFQEKSRLRIMDGLRRFIMVDNREAVKLDSEKNMEWRPVVTPKFTADFLEAVQMS